jgi:AraC family transcriptional regulator of adaptative response / DNA-3-methyladenine glycosylase II
LNPRDIRRGTGHGAGRSAAAPVLVCQLDFRPPLAWQNLLAYLRLRAIPGVEHVDATHYRRTVALGPHQGCIAVSLARNGSALDVEVSPGLAPVIGAVIVRVKHLFDLGATPDAVSDVLSQDPLLAEVVRRLPGLRVAGAFDGFELAVRAVLGQQVSVKAATTMAGRWAQTFGTPIATSHPELTHLAPTPSRMLEVAVHEIGALGVVGSRARCLEALAQAVAERRVVLSYAANVEEQLQRLTELPGVGPWTAQYIAMRALRWPDAFPAEDLMVLRAAKMGKKELLARAEGWRPWRAYATHYLWQSLGVHP